MPIYLSFKTKVFFKKNSLKTWALNCNVETIGSSLDYKKSFNPMWNIRITNVVLFISIFAWFCSLMLIVFFLLLSSFFYTSPVSFCSESLKVPKKEFEDVTEDFVQENTLDMFFNEKPQNTDPEVSLYCPIWREQNSSRGGHLKNASPKGKFRQQLYYSELS